MYEFEFPWGLAIAGASVLVCGFFAAGLLVGWWFRSQRLKDLEEQLKLARELRDQFAEKACDELRTKFGNQGFADQQRANADAERIHAISRLAGDIRRLARLIDCGGPFRTEYGLPLPANFVDPGDPDALGRKEREIEEWHERTLEERRATHAKLTSLDRAIARSAQ